MDADRTGTAVQECRHEGLSRVVLDRVDQDLLGLPVGPPAVLVVEKETVCPGGLHHSGEQVGERAAGVDGAQSRYVRHGHHRLVERRQQPRRRDVLLRFFHALFAGKEGVGLNSHECAVAGSNINRTVCGE
ncbi:hypothetical protein ACFRDV_40180 [Streptomyces fagopyri]|uniref:hypothetical protein n=1 Tax=Streptomyces fagopyri TaxID=2662397 RepID=UPI0036A5AF9D